MSSRVIISADALHAQLAYTAWASKRLLESASELSAGELTRDLGTSEKSVLGTLVHVFGADRIWIARLASPEAVPGLVTERDYSLQVLIEEWPAIWDRWHELIEQRSGDLAQRCPYLARGGSWSQPLWHIVLHVVNHGSHHRGQVSGFLRILGHPPPPLDLIAFYRQIDLEAAVSARG